MWISLYAGFLLALPVVIYQVWAFFAPAFAPQTQRVVVGLSAFAGLLAACGLAFGYFVALPAAVHFLTNYDDHLYDIQIRAKDYLAFASVVLFAVTIVFEVPIVILGLVRIGVLSSAKLRRNRRTGYVVMAAIAVALPGVDPVTTMMEMVPLWLLFEGSIWLSVLLERRMPAPQEALL
jgi:sec-independent protein translocase protein TatC